MRPHGIMRGRDHRSPNGGIRMRVITGVNALGQKLDVSMHRWL
jgi:hypothetical protein